MTSYVIYDGPSLIDGSPIVCIAQEPPKKSNVKTGAMMQTYIIRSDVDPLSASKNGQDKGVCGSCVHRGTQTSEKGLKQAKNRTCYVVLFQGPLIKWKGYSWGKYETVRGHEEIKKVGKGQMVRIGTYGDGAAVPEYVWDSLCEDAEGWTAYTHQDNPNPNRYMTSADTLDQAEVAWKKGHRTFRTISSVDQVVKGKEIICPATEEGGKRVQCIDCKLCCGTSVKGKSIAAVVHGVNKNNAKKLIDSLTNT